MCRRKWKMLVLGVLCRLCGQSSSDLEVDMQLNCSFPRIWLPLQQLYKAFLPRCATFPWITCPSWTHVAKPSVPQSDGRTQSTRGSCPSTSIPLSCSYRGRWTFCLWSSPARCIRAGLVAPYVSEGLQLKLGMPLLAVDGIVRIGQAPGSPISRPPWVCHPSQCAPSRSCSCCPNLGKAAHA